MKPEDIAGPAAVRALQDAGYTLVGPKEPARIVTMEESKERFRLAVGVAHVGSLPECYYAADDWLVKTVNRRIIEGLSHTNGFISTSPSWSAYRPDLLRLFCGEGT